MKSKSRNKNHYSKINLDNVSLLYRSNKKDHASKVNKVAKNG